MNMRHIFALGFILTGSLASQAWAVCEVHTSDRTYADGTVLNGTVCDSAGALKISGDLGNVTVNGADGAITDGATPTIKATVKNYTNSKPLTTIIVDTNGDPASVGGGTEVTEDAAAAANPTGKMDMCRRRDTLTAAEVSADSDIIAKNCTAKGEVYVKHTDAVPVTDNGGSLTVDGTVSISGTVTVSDGAGALNVIVDSSALPTGAAQDSTLTGGTQKAIVRGGAKGSTSATDVTSTASGANHQPLDVVIYDTSGNAITSFGGSGGTSSNFGSAFPTPGTAAGFTDGTNMVAGRVVTSAPGTSDAGLVVRNINPNLAADNSTNSTAKTPVLPALANTSAPTWTNGNQVPLSVDTSGALRVTGGTSATQYTEDAASAGAESLTLAGTIRQDTPAGSTSADGDYANLKTDSVGRLWVNGSGVTQPVSGTVSITSNSAVNVSQFNGVTPLVGAGNTGSGSPRVTIATDQAALPGMGVYVEDAAETAGGNLSMSGSVRRDTAASSAGSTGDNATINTDQNGLLWTRNIDPCTALAKTYIAINISTATTTELTPSLAGASTNYYVCSLNLVTAAANNVALVDDDTDNCASVTSGLAGGTTAASGWNFAANGGMTFGNGQSSVFKTNGANRVLCLVTSAATQLSGNMTVVAAP